jgi:predicted dienelactone hydrolase
MHMLRMAIQGTSKQAGHSQLCSQMRSQLRRLAAALALACLGLGLGVGSAPAQKVEAFYHAGVVTRDFHPTEPPRNWRGEDGHDLRAVIWYPAPTEAVERPQFIGATDAPLFDAGMAAPDAPLAPLTGKHSHGWPLVLLSHGSGGSALQMAWLGTALARAGFIAVAIDHPGNNADAPMTLEGIALWWERATDLSQTLDMMLVDDVFGKKIDPSRVGAAGYSLGGYTVLELAGAQTDVHALFAACKQNTDLAVCHIPEARGMGDPLSILRAVRQTSAESLARSDELYSDDRITAVFAIAPALGFTMTDDSLRAIRLPVEMVAGDVDTIAPIDDNADYLRHEIRGARLTLLPKVGHYAFLDTCTALGRQKYDRYCTDDLGVERETVHQRTAAEAILFFKHTLH